MEKRKPFYIVGGNVSWHSHYGKQYGGSSDLKIELLYDPAISFLGIYPDRTIIQKDTQCAYCLGQNQKCKEKQPFKCFWKQKNIVFLRKLKTLSPFSFVIKAH